MKKYRLKKTDLEVSRIAYGTWHLGGSWDDSPLSADLKRRASRLLSLAMEEGINHLDLADIYTRGKSDEAVGCFLKENQTARDKLVIQGKVGIRLENTPEAGLPQRYDFSEEHITSTVESSLKRLNTDYFDILALHRPDPLIEPEKLANVLHRLYRDGKVRYFGVSNHNWAQIELIKKHLVLPVIVNQIELNLLHSAPITDGILFNTGDNIYNGSLGTLDYCRLNDVTIQAWSPVAGGAIFKEAADSGPENNLKTVLSNIATENDTTPQAVALAWLLRHPAGIQPIIGTLNEDRLASYAEADKISITRENWYSLLEAARQKRVP